MRGPEGGRPVVWVHGWPGSRLEQLLIPEDAIARQGIRLIAVDRPGYGDSDPRSGSRAERMADVLDVCDMLDIDRFSAIGASCGGHNVVALAAAAPERVTQIVLSSAQMPYDDESALAAMEQEQLDELALVRWGRTPEIETKEEEYRQDLLSRGTEAALTIDRFSDDEQRWLQLPWVSEALDADIRDAARVSAEGLIEDSLMCVKPFEFSMDAVRCPVYAVHGTEDDWEPLANLQRYLDQFRQSQLILMVGLKHVGPLMFPDLLLSLAARTN